MTETPNVKTFIEIWHDNGYALENYFATATRWVSHAPEKNIHPDAWSILGGAPVNVYSLDDIAAYRKLLDAIETEMKSEGRE